MTCHSNKEYICAQCLKEIFLDDPGIFLFELPSGQSLPLCGADCAKEFATQRGQEYVIEDKKGNVVETNSHRMN